MDKPACDHNHEFIGRPFGVQPLEWECCNCGTRFTPGELAIWHRLRLIERTTCPTYEPKEQNDG